MDRVAAIRERLTAALGPVSLEVIDDSHKHAGHPGAASGAGHFEVRIVSDRFESLPQIRRHRLVYDAVADLMGPEIHALSIKAQTPAES